MNYEYEPSPYGQMLDRSKDLSSLTHRFEIIEMIVAPNRPEGFQDMYQRSFTSRLTLGDKENILKEVASTGSISNASNITNNILSISATPLGLASITGSWRDNRYSFKLTVKCIPKTATIYGATPTTYDLIITGYSDPSNDFATQNYGGNYIVNQNLKFHINSVQRVAINTNRNVITEIKNLGVTEPFSFHNTQANICVRPSDIVSGINSQSLGRHYAGATYAINQTADLTPASYARAHSMGKKYVNDIVNAVVTSVGESAGVSAFQDMFSSFDQQAMTDATIKLRTDMINTDPFFQALQQLRLGEVGYTFSVNDLMVIDPTFNTNRITYALVEDIDRVGSDSILQSVYTMDLSGADRLAGKVTELHNIMTNLLTTNFLAHLELRILNVYQTHPSGYGMALVPKWEAPSHGARWSYGAAGAQIEAIHRLKHNIQGYVDNIIDPLMSEQGNLQYEVSIVADMATDTTILVKIENEPPVLYRFPTFADMAFTPMVANDYVKEQLVTNMEALTSDLINVVSTFDPPDRTLYPDTMLINNNQK